MHSNNIIYDGYTTGYHQACADIKALIDLMVKLVEQKIPNEITREFGEQVITAINKMERTVK